MTTKTNDVKGEKSAVDWEYIHVYSRADAIRDGVLVDVSEMAKEAGFLCPVAITRAVYAECVAVPDGVDCQDEAGRLWDVVWMSAFAVRRASSGDEVPVSLQVRNDNCRPTLVRLNAVVGPGDNRELVVTIMYSHED